MCPHACTLDWHLNLQAWLLSTCLSGCLATDTKIEHEIRAFQRWYIGQKLSKFFKFKNFSFWKIMNNGDTVAKRDFTAGFKSKKRRGFWMIYNENLARNESKCIDVLGQVLLSTMCKIFSKKYEDFSKLYQK
jgi:hypothetical protein